jgi:hypothetical protein
MVAGSVIMVNLIVAIIITDVKNLVDASREQALVNEESQNQNYATHHQGREESS